MPKPSAQRPGRGLERRAHQAREVRAASTESVEPSASEASRSPDRFTRRQTDWPEPIVRGYLRRLRQPALSR